MKTITFVLASLAALSLADATAAQNAMKDTPGMAMSGVKHGHGTGVIKALDVKAGSITLQHGPIAAVSWPAMTMPFKAKPALLKGLKVGQTIDFDCDVTGMSATVTAIQRK